ncbi:piercer of microtubule wall 1 protein [Uranotaenia lowii]|uniref:piercer of microtubule wall 1 protein n=1 Tax=Uranotaenia lowii TaxID=190385 RepID=UPI002479A6EA|nr:piercer of microtubule wall 1 protein [Uranotaenia lowii]
MDSLALPNQTTEGSGQEHIFKGLTVSNTFESSYQFKGYGNQKPDLNPVYRTSNSEYGYFPPCPHTVPHKYFPKSCKFTDHLYQCGMFRNYSLNTAVDRAYCDYY